MTSQRCCIYSYGLSSHYIHFHVKFNALVTLSLFQVGAIFLFNLLVGVGILALPSAIAKAGIIAGVICLVTVSFMAFMSATFMIEVLATANTWRRTKSVTRRGCPSQNELMGETKNIKIKTDVLSPPLFEIEQKFEMGYMSELFLGSVGSTFFYAVLCLYLYGVSIIYSKKLKPFSVLLLSYRNMSCSFVKLHVSGEKQRIESHSDSFSLIITIF